MPVMGDLGAQLEEVAPLDRLQPVRDAVQHDILRGMGSQTGRCTTGVSPDPFVAGLMRSTA